MKNPGRDGAVRMRFGETSALTSVIYVLVGLAGAYRLVALKGVDGGRVAVPSR